METQKNNPFRAVILVFAIAVALMSTVACCQDRKEAKALNVSKAIVEALQIDFRTARTSVTLLKR